MAKGYLDVCERKKSNKYGSSPVSKGLYIRRCKRAVEFYLDTTTTWKYHELIEHLRTSFKSGEAFSSLIGDFIATYNDLRKQKTSLPMSLKF